MALTFIGKPISLISHSDVRYRGILAGIDPAASTIQLSNVYSMGTEQRRPPAEFIPPVQEPYQYIIFRASEVKDLAVDEPAPRRSVHDDPAVLGASAPPIVPTAGYSPYPAPAVAAIPVQPKPQASPNFAARPPAATAPQPASSSQPQIPASQPNAQASQGGQQQQSSTRRMNPVHTAAASLETVERALGDLRVSNAAPNTTGRGGRRGHGGRDARTEIKVPTTDFDFQGSNAKFDKAALAPNGGRAGNGTGAGDDVDTNPSDEDGDAKEKEDKDKDSSKDKEKTPAYNPQKSFFDSLTPGPAPVPAEVVVEGEAGVERDATGAKKRGSVTLRHLVSPVVLVSWGLAHM
ncbi:Scd6-like Sm domain-containing protein [Infundibulicybe gibba]|nr:Scd6-like Sm domain-containing protein [Infundibulicybe gibba]